MEQDRNVLFIYYVFFFYIPVTPRVDNIAAFHKLFLLFFLEQYYLIINKKLINKKTEAQNWIINYNKLLWQRIGVKGLWQRAESWT